MAPKRKVEVWLDEADYRRVVIEAQSRGLASSAFLRTIIIKTLSEIKSKEERAENV